MIAIASSEYEKWGCPHCGYRSAYRSVSFSGAANLTCGDCNKGFIILAEGVTKCPFGLGSAKGESVYPELQPHPRAGTPNHGAPDNPPKQGEYFNSRGIGSDGHLCCFVCGEKDLLLSNIAAFVQCKASGERVVEMFGGKARLDYRDFEPDRVQVKIGACKTHLPNLRQLHSKVSAGVITLKILAQVLSRETDEERHDLCHDNKQAIAESQQCGCFYCCKIFSAREIVEFVGKGKGKGKSAEPATALCPHCGIDAVLPDNQIELTPDLLTDMCKLWFSPAERPRAEES